MVPLLFLVAGLLTPGSLARKGQRRYVRDRLLRLGLPFGVFTLLIWPAVLYARCTDRWATRVARTGPSSWGQPRRASTPGNSVVGDLLIFSSVCRVGADSGPARRPRGAATDHRVAPAAPCRCGGPSRPPWCGWRSRSTARSASISISSSGRRTWLPSHWASPRRGGTG